MTTQDAFVLDNANMVYSIANKHFSHYPHKNELYQVGSMALTKAYRNYNPEYGVKVKDTTYAYKYILGEMRQHIQKDRTIKVSNEISSLSRRIERDSNLLAQELMREPTAKELSMYLGINEFDISEATRSGYPIQSFDYSTNIDGETLNPYDYIASMDRTNMDDLIALRTELARLDPYDRRLIEARYLMDMTQSEAAQMLGTSQVQVSRQEQKVLNRLRCNLKQ